MEKELSLPSKNNRTYTRVELILQLIALLHDLHMESVLMILYAFIQIRNLLATGCLYS